MIECKVSFDYSNNTQYPNILSSSNPDGCLTIQNFINTILNPESPVNWENWEANLGFTDEEYQALLDNAELLGIKFTAEEE